MFAIGAAAVVALPATASSVFNSQGTPQGTPPLCDPILLLLQGFDGVTPPVLPPGWSRHVVTITARLPWQ
jgi:hypothetical protein